MPILRTEWSLLLRTPQQRLQMLFNGPDNPKNCPFPWGISTPCHAWFLGLTRVPPLPKPQDDSIGSAVFCRAHRCAQQTDRQTDHATCDVCRKRPHAIKTYIYAVILAKRARWPRRMLPPGESWCICRRDRQTDRRTSNRYITLFARRGRRNKKWSWKRTYVCILIADFT